MPLNLRYTTSLNGGMIFTGNTLGLSQDTDLYQPGVQGSMGAFTSLDLTNQVNAFPAGTTLNYLEDGSEAQLVLPPGSTVVRAELIWGAIYSYNYIFTGNPEPPASATVVGLINNPVLFNGISINPDPTTAQEFTLSSAGFSTVQWYMRSADVTAIVQANGVGTYSVEQVPAVLTNISNYVLRTGHVGWTLAVVYENPTVEYTNVYLYVGSQGITSAIGAVDIPIGGFETFPAGAINTNLYLSAQEGDGDISGDQALFGPNAGSLTNLSGPVNSSTNFFGGIITDSSGNLDTSGTFGTRNNNTLTNTNTIGSRHGWDINTQNVSSLMTNSQTDAVVRITTVGDAYMVNAIGLTTNTVLADTTLTKSVDRSVTKVGDELEYSYLIENNGNVAMQLIVVTDSVPTETTFVPGSVIINGIPDGTANPEVGISIPDIPPGGTATLSFRVTVDTMPNPNVILNTGILNYEYGGVTVPGTVTSNEVQTIVLEPFVCDTFIYQVVAELLQNSQFRRINTVTGDVEIVKIDMGYEINAIGYNILDNYIYGLRTVFDGSGNSIQRNLVQIDALGNVVDLGPIPNVTDTSGLNVGAIDDQGFYYFKRANADYYWTVDLRPGSLTYGQLVDPTNGYIATTTSTPILPSGTLTQGDWTYNVNDGLLYSVTDPATQFLTLDPTTGQINLLPTQGGLPLEYGGMASDGQGFIYGIDNTTGDVIRWENVGGTMEGELFSQTLGTIRNDATMCLNAIIELDFGDAPDTSVGTSLGNYRTLLSDNGPRHQIINELFIGQAVTAEVDGLQNPTATGDVDDGLTPPVQIPIAIGNFSVPVDFTNNTGQTANIYAWIDYNQDGIFQTNESFTTTIPSQVGVQTINLNFTGIPTTLETDTFMRVRITTDTLVNTGGPTNEDTRSFGAAIDGEVEDYLVDMFGDAELTVVKSQSASIVDVGDTITYTIDITNIGNISAINSILTDIVPNGTSYVPGTLTVDNVLSGDDLAIGVTLPSPIVRNQVVTVKFDIIIDTIPIPNPIVNFAVADYLSNGLPLTAQSNQVTATVNVADLSIVKTASPSPVNAGEQIVYTLLIANAGPNSAENVDLTDTIPAQINNVEYSLDGGTTWVPWVGNLSIGTIAAFASVTVLIRGNVAANATGTLINTADVTSTTADPNLSNNTDTVTTPIEQLADMSIIKTASPDPVIAGEQLIYTLTVTNAGPSNAGNVNVTDVIPLNGTQYSLNGGITWLLWTGNIAIGTFTPGQTLDILIRGIVPQNTIGSINNTATVSSTTPDPILANNTDTITTQVDTLADVRIIKTASPDPVIAGEELIYTLVVSNAGPSDALNVAVTDAAPLDNPEYSLDNGLSWLPWLGTINIGTLVVGASVNILLRGLVPEDTIGSIDNTATVSSITPDSNPLNNTDTVTTEVDTLADISVVKTIDTIPAIAGLELIYNLTVSNSGPSNAQNVNLNDTVPLNNPEYSIDGGTTWIAWAGNINLGTLTPGTSIGILVRGIIPSDETGVLINTAVVTTTTPDLNPANNIDTVSIDVDELADISVIKSATPDPVIAGEEISYTLVVSNAGPSDAVSVNLTDAVPINNAQFSLDNGVTWLPWIGNSNLGTIAVGNSLIVLVRGIVPSSTLGNLANTATVTSITPDPNPSNNVDRITTEIDELADVSIIKTINQNPVVAGSQAIYTLEVTNSGPSDALNVTITDIVPLDNSEYSLNGGTTWLPWVGTVNIGTLIIGATTEILIRGDVPADAMGTLTNVASVTSTTPDPDTSNNIDTIATPISELADLSIVKTATPNPGIAGEELIYTLVVNNAGPSNAQNVTIDDILPLNNQEYSVDGGVSWFLWPGSINIGILLAGNSRNILIRGIISEGVTGSISNTAVVSSTTPDPNLTNNTDTVTTQIDTLVDVSIVKTANPDPVIAGEQLNYTLVVNNAGPSTALNVAVTDAIPLNNPEYSVNNGVTWLPWLGSITLGTLLVNSPVTILLRGIVPTDTIGNIDNTAVVTTTSPDSNPNNNTDTVRTQVETLADISVIKTASPDPVIAGEELVYNLLVSNVGPSDALSVDLADVVPLDTAEYSLDNGITWSVWTGNVNLGTIILGASVVVLIRGIVPSGVVADIINTATVTSITPDPNLTNNTDSVITVVNELADVSIIKTIDQNPAIAGAQIIYTLVATNAGPSDAVDVTITDAVALSNSEYSINNGISWLPWLGTVNIGILAMGDSATVLIRGNLPSESTGNLVNTADVTSITPDPDLTNNTDTIVTPIEKLADLEIIKITTPFNRTLGDEVIYNLVITNNGPSDAQNVSLQDDVPVELLNQEFSLDAGLTWIAWSTPYIIGTLLAGDSITILIRGIIANDALGIVSNTGTVTGTTPDPDLSNNTSTADIDVLYGDLVSPGNFVKDLDKEYADVGEEITYTITVTNTGNVNTNNVIITDPIPADTSYVANSLTIDGIPSLSNPETGITLVNPIVPGETVVIAFRVLVERLPVPNPIPNQATVDYTYTVDPQNPDSEAINGETNEVLTKVNTADLIGDNGENFVKTVDKLFTDVDEEITYTISVTNTGNVDANNVVITDPIPNGTSYVFGSLLVDGIPNPSNPGVGIILASPIAPNQTVILEFKVLVEEVPVPNPIPNKATVDYTYTVDPAEPDGAVNSGETNEVFTQVNTADLIGDNGENFVKSVDKDFTDIGEEITYTVNITNTGSVDANNIIVVDIIPNGTSYVVDSLLVNGVPNASNPELGINLSPIGPNETTVLEFRVLVEEIPVPNPIPNTAAITYTYTVDPSNPNSVTDGGITNEVLTKVNNATIESEKFVDKIFADVNEEITYTIDLTNTGNVNANNLILTDIIPNGTSYVAGSLTVNGGLNPSNPETGITLTNPILPGATTVVIFKVLIEEIPVPNPIPNNATGIFTYTVDPADPDAQSGEFETNTVQTQVNNADLIGDNGENFVKAVDKGYADVGEEITYTVSVTNTGNVPANNVVITDPIPSGTSFVNGSLTISGVPNPSNPATGIVLANPIQPNNTVIVVFKVLVEEIPDPNPIPNKAFVEYTYTVDPAKPNGASDSGETNEVLTKVNNADLIGNNGENFVKSVDKEFTDTEKALTYTIRVTNTGNVNANNVIIKDPIPNDTTYIAGSLRINGVANPSNPETGIILTKPIQPSETVIIIFKVFVEDIPVPNPIPNKATVDYTYTVDPADPNGASNSGETNEVLTKVNSANLIIIKSSDELYKDLGDTVLYTIEIFNDGNVSANNVFFSDNLPSELEFVVDSVFIDGVNFIGYDPEIGFNLLNIAPLATRVITFEALVIEAPKNLNVENIAVVNYTHVIDPNLPEVPATKISNADNVIISHGEISEEGLVKAANKEIVTEADIIKYTVDATNSGNVPVNNVVLRDVLPVGVDFIVGTVTINGIGAPLADPNIGINLGSINAGKTVKVAFNVKVQENPPTELINTATIDYEYTVNPDEPPIEKTQESNQVLIDVIIPEVILEKSADIALATIGDIITYTLVATNTGEIDVFDVIVKDLLEPDVNFIEKSVKVDGILFVNASILTGINIGALAIGQAKTITFKAEVIAKTNDFIDNVSTGVYSFIVDPKGPTRIDSFESNLNRIPLEKYELTIDKIANKSIATLNEIITYSVKLVNTGEVELINILFKDNLPKNLEFVENSFTLNGVIVNDVSLEDGVNVGSLNSGQMKFITYQAKVISGSLTGYSINNAYAEFDYKLSNDVTGSNQTEIVQAIVEIPISSFKQMIINTDLCISKMKPDIEELDDVVTDIEIIDNYVVDVLEEISNEGQILTGKKLIIHGYMHLSVKYTALVESQSMHSVEKVLPFSTFIMLPNVYKCEKLDVTSAIEDVESHLLCCRKVGLSAVVMFRALICAD